LVLGSFSACIFGNRSISGRLLGGMAAGDAACYYQFLHFCFTRSPLWIAGISQAMIFEAVAFFLKVGSPRPL
jgi:ribose transport system permease protein